MISQISANDLKVKGITAIDALAEGSEGIVVTVRGKEKYIILPIEEYNQLRELELEAAIREAREDIEAGRYVAGTVEEHLSRLDGV